MAKSLLDVTKNYTEFSRQYRAYLKRTSAPEYAEDRFAWFRPKDFENTADPSKIATAFPADELAEDARTLIRQGNCETGSDGDYAMLAMQHDLLTSANRAFASRHRSKLRHFAASAGTQDRVGGEYGTFHYSYDMTLTNINETRRSTATFLYVMVECVAQFTRACKLCVTYRSVSGQAMVSSCRIRTKKESLTKGTPVITAAVCRVNGRHCSLCGFLSSCPFCRRHRNNNRPGR